jgi:hypothetical protein
MSSEVDNWPENRTKLNEATQASLPKQTEFCYYPTQLSDPKEDATTDTLGPETKGKP